jgi:hypothetical protein
MQVICISSPQKKSLIYPGLLYPMRRVMDINLFLCTRALERSHVGQDRRRHGHHMCKLHGRNCYIPRSEKKIPSSSTPKLQLQDLRNRSFGRVFPAGERHKTIMHYIPPKQWSVFLWITSHAMAFLDITSIWGLILRKSKIRGPAFLGLGDSSLHDHCPEPSRGNPSSRLQTVSST